MTDTIKELKPCPFCGEAAALEQIGNWRQSTIVACINCGARHECGEEFGHGTAWNTRTDVEAYTQATADRIEQLVIDVNETHEEAMSWIEKWGDALKGQREAEAKLAKAVEALREIKAVECEHCTDYFHQLANEVLAELEKTE